MSRNPGMWRLLCRSPPITKGPLGPRTRLQAASKLFKSTRDITTSSRNQAKNQIYDAVRRPSDFHTYHLLSASSRVPLLTLWTTSWCPTCRVVSPVIHGLVESGVGEAEGGVGFCTVEYDAPDIMKEGLGHEYVISSVPTLMAFDEVGPRMSTRIMDPEKMTDEKFLEAWIREEARRIGGGTPGSWFKL